MLTEEQRKTFAARGLLRLPRCIAAPVVTDMRERVLSSFDRVGLPRCGPPDVDGADLRHAMKRLRKTGGLDRLYDQPSIDAAQSLLEEPAAERSRALLLLTMPTSEPNGAGAWHVPHKVWHTDCPRLPGGAVPGIIVLAFIDTVRPQGGGTLVVAGSHRLFASPERGLSSRQFKKQLRRHDFFRTLFREASPERHRYLLAPHCVDGVRLEVVELTGQPGDAVLLDGRILHTLAPNCLQAPRLMARGFYASVRLFSSYHAAAAERPKAGPVPRVRSAPAPTPAQPRPHPM